MKNGPGNNGYAVAHEAWSGVCWSDPSPLGGMDCIAPSRLYNLEGVFSFWGKKDPGVPVLSFATVLAETIAFADPLDLGGGRRVWCGSRSGGVLCIASSHGPAPGSPQFNNPQQAAHAAAMNDENRGIPSSHSALTGNSSSTSLASPVASIRDRVFQIRSRVSVRSCRTPRASSPEALSRARSIRRGQNTRRTCASAATEDVLTPRQLDHWREPAPH
jgi:hypothetical protein